MMKVLKQMLEEAKERGLYQGTAHKSKRLNTPTDKTDKIYLDSTEIDRIHAFDFSDNKRLEKVRDLFLIGCNTGLRYSDFTNIRDEHFSITDGKKYLTITTQKTSTKVQIPINKAVEDILSRNGGKPPAKMSIQKMNDYLKEIGEKVGLNQPTVVHTTKGGVKEEKTHPQYELISSHTARRSFATNAYKAGIPVKSIMLITGHTTERQFFTYIKIGIEENAIKLSDQRGEATCVACLGTPHRMRAVGRRIEPDRFRCLFLRPAKPLAAWFKRKHQQALASVLPERNRSGAAFASRAEQDRAPIKRATAKNPGLPYAGRAI